VPERVVLLHASLGDSRLWSRQVRLLEASGYDVIAPDLPGFGDEPMPRASFSFVDFVEKLLPATLVGNSIGGRIALETALAHSAKVRRLVVVAPGLAGYEFGTELQDYWRLEEELVERGDLDAATQLNLDFWVDPTYHELVRPMQRRAFDLQTAHDEPALEWPAARPLSELTMPTLVVVGEHDEDDMRTIAERVAREAPNARLEVVPGAGHLVAIEAPDAFEEVLLEFLESG
jgi:pimeloyl-ACP methyl ester carboxylesterase